MFIFPFKFGKMDRAFHGESLPCLRRKIRMPRDRPRAAEAWTLEGEGLRNESATTQVFNDLVCVQSDRTRSLSVPTESVRAASWL